MKIFSENEDFKKDFYTILGVVVKQPTCKRKWHKTGQLYPLCHWFLELFISAKHSVRIELVEACESQKTKLSKFTESAIGSVVVIENCDMWSYNDGVMEEKIHRITFFNPSGKLAEDFLNGLTSKLDCDESLSSNTSWCPTDQYTVKKFKQVIRLGQYFARTKKILTKDFKPKDNLQEAMKNHYVKDDIEDDAVEYNPYIRPDNEDDKDVIIGVGADFYYDAERKEEFINIIITTPDSKKQNTLKVLVPRLNEVSKTNHAYLMQIEVAIQKRLILMINHVKKNGDIYEFDSGKKNAVIIYDAHGDVDKKYGMFLKVR